MATVKKTIQAPRVSSVKKRVVSTKETGTNLLEKYRAHEGDTGSTEVQITLMSERITSLIDHLKAHKKDHDSRRGLLLMVGKRRRLLSYLRLENADRYQQLIADLGLRK